MTSPVINMALVVFISTVDIFDLIQNFDNKYTGTKEHMVFVYIRFTVLGVTTHWSSVCLVNIHLVQGRKTAQPWRRQEVNLAP